MIGNKLPTCPCCHEPMDTITPVKVSIKVDLVGYGQYREYNLCSMCSYDVLKDKLPKVYEELIGKTVEWLESE